jgi:REP element-mobilizing transposase RayT
MIDGDLQITRRHLPHWTISGAQYFITFRTKTGTLSLDEQVLTLEHIKSGHEKYYMLFAVVVMSDHVHLLLEPKEQYSLSEIMRGIKGVSARKINHLRNSTGAFWQDESFDRIIRDQKEFEEKLNYMYNNPLKSGLTNDPNLYHGWFCNYDVL